jgi:hypothetical protein
MAASNVSTAARLSVKAPLDIPPGADLEPVIGVFHGWIQRSALDGLLLDVADYRHVHNGPAVMLIGHERDHVLDLADGRPGLACIDKRAGEGATLAEQVVAVGERARAAAALLADEPALEGWSVGDGPIEIRVLDRLLAPAGAEGERAVAPAVEDAARRLLGDAALVEAVPAPQGPVTFRLLAGAGSR